MNTTHTVINYQKLDLAIERLELFLDPENQLLLEACNPSKPKRLTTLSKYFSLAPSVVKKKLDALRSVGLIYSPKRFPAAYATNQIKCLKVKFKAKRLIN